MKQTSAFLVAVFALTLTACNKGGDGGNPNSPSAAPQAYHQTVVGTVGSFGIVQHEIGPLPRGGQMTLTLTWPGGGDLDMYLTQSGCSGYPPSNCQILARADSATGSTESLVRTVAQGEQLKLWVDSFVVSASRNYELTISVR